MSEHRPNGCCDFHRHIADGCCHCGDDKPVTAPRADLDELGRLLAAHRDSYPMGNIHHGTPENPDWGTFCVECKQSWPCDVSRLAAEVAELRETVASVKAEVPAQCWVARSGSVFRCTSLIGATFTNGAIWTAEMCCLPCRITAALDGAQ